MAEGEEAIGAATGKPALWADLALIAAAQRVEHYEISAYGSAKCLARQLNQPQCELLLSHTLGEEERADFMLSDIAQPLLQRASLEDNNGADADLEGKKFNITVGCSPPRRTPAAGKTIAWHGKHATVLRQTRLNTVRGIYPLLQAAAAVL